MNDTFTHPTQEELNEYLRRARRERSEAIAVMFRRAWMKLFGRPQAPASTPVDARYA